MHTQTPIKQLVIRVFLRAKDRLIRCCKFFGITLTDLIIRQGALDEILGKLPSDYEPRERGDA